MDVKYSSQTPQLEFCLHYRSARIGETLHQPHARSRGRHTFLPLTAVMYPNQLSDNAYAVGMSCQLVLLPGSPWRRLFAPALEQTRAQELVHELYFSHYAFRLSGRRCAYRAHHGPAGEAWPSPPISVVGPHMSLATLAPVRSKGNWESLRRWLVLTLVLGETWHAGMRSLPTTYKGWDSLSPIGLSFACGWSTCHM